MAARITPGADLAGYYDHFGPLREPLLDERVSEVMVNGTRGVWCEREGRLEGV